MIKLTERESGPDLEIVNFDLPMEYKEAIKACDSLGSEWKIPTIEQLQEIYRYLHRKGKGNFKTDHAYLSSSEYFDYNDFSDVIYHLYFYDGSISYGWHPGKKFHVCAVKAL